jgi:hypothetical protein
MKPIIKKQPYNILFMRDDAAVRTISVRGGAITAACVFLLLVIAGGALGIWGGIRYWQKYDALSSLHKQQERELLEARLQLERYVNYETLLEAANGAAPLAKNEEIGTAVPSARAHNATQAAAFPAAQNGTRPSVAAPAKVGGNATQVQHNATLPLAAAADAAQPSAAAPLISSAASPLRINGFVGRIISAQRLRVRYELSAIPSEDQKAVSGLAKYAAVFSDGTEMELAVQDAGDARFAISRMKPMEASLRLPQNIASRDISQIQVILEIDEGRTYSETFPLTR